MDTTVLGIDLGTTRLRAAVASGRSVRAVLGIDAPFSSAVAESEGRWQAGAEPSEGTIDRWKWLLGRSSDIDAGWITTDVLQQVMSRGLRNPQSPHLAVLTVPASFDDAARAMLSNSARMASLSLREMLCESTALMCDQLQPGAAGHFAAIVGGAGHLEVAILEAGDGVLAVRARRSLRSVHGDNYAHAVAQCLLQDLGEKTGQDLRQERALLAHLVRPVQSALEAWNGVTDLRVQLPSACAVRVQGMPEWLVPMAAMQAVTALCVKHMSPVLLAALSDAQRRVGDVSQVRVRRALARERAHPVAAGVLGAADHLRERGRARDGRRASRRGPRGAAIDLGGARHPFARAVARAPRPGRQRRADDGRARGHGALSASASGRVVCAAAERVALHPAAAEAHAGAARERRVAPAARARAGLVGAAPAVDAAAPRAGHARPARRREAALHAARARRDTAPSTPPARPPSTPPAPVAAKPPSTPPAPVAARPPSTPPPSRAPSSPPPMGDHASRFLSQGTFRGVSDIEAFRALPLTRSPTAEEVEHPALPVLLLWIAAQPELHGVLTLTSGNDRIDLTFIDRGPVTYFAERKRQLRIFTWSSGHYTWSPMPPSAQDMKNREPMMSFLASGLRESLREFSDDTVRPALAPWMPQSPRVPLDRRRRVNRLGLTDHELRAIDHAFDGSRELRDMLGEGFLGRATLTRLLLLLDVFGCLTWEAPVVNAQLDPAAQLARRVERMQGLNHFEVLGIHWSATAAEVAEAWHRFEGEYGPHGTWGHVDGPSAARLLTLGRHAWSVLADDRSRARYRKEAYPTIDAELLGNLLESRVKALAMRGDNTGAHRAAQLLGEISAPRQQ